MDKKLSLYATPLIILLVFLFAFHYLPSVKEGYLDTIVSASVLTPLFVVFLGKAGLCRAVLCRQLPYNLFMSCMESGTRNTRIPSPTVSSPSRAT